GGKLVTEQDSMRVSVDPGGPADVAQIHNGDRVVSVDDKPVANWDDLKKAVGTHAGESIEVLLERDGADVHAKVTPEPAGPNKGKIRVGPYQHMVPGPAGEALTVSLVQ